MEAAIIAILVASGWLAGARHGYRSLIKADWPYARPEARFTGFRPEYREASRCPHYMMSWHRISTPCKTCGTSETTTVYPAHPKGKRFALALAAGPLLFIALMLWLCVTGKQPLTPSERERALAEREQALTESEKDLAEATARMKKAQD